MNTLASAFMRLGLTIVLAGLTIGHAALAEPPDARPDVTVEAVLPGCRSLVATQGVPTSSEAGFCSGLIDALLYLGAILPPDFCYAVPLDIPQHRVVAAIVEEIEPVYPSVRGQHFRALAIDVLEYKWPCHGQPYVLTRE
jgi:hypothetical protein